MVIHNHLQTLTKQSEQCLLCKHRGLLRPTKVEVKRASNKLYPICLTCKYKQQLIKRMESVALFNDWKMQYYSEASSTSSAMLNKQLTPIIHQVRQHSTFEQQPKVILRLKERHTFHCTIAKRMKRLLQCLANNLHQQFNRLRNMILFNNCQRSIEAKRTAAFYSPYLTTYTKS